MEECFEVVEWGLSEEELRVVFEALVKAENLLNYDHCVMASN